MESLEELLYRCTVKLTVSGQRGWGTGFFVAPGQILTCAHVIKAAEQTPVNVRWQQQEDFLEAAVEKVLPSVDLALLRFTPRSDVNLPCVYLDTALKSGDELYLFGYPDQDFPDGCPVTGSCEGFTGDRLIKFKLGQVRPGVSGSALLNQHTGKVCGIVKFTRDRSLDLGGGAVPTETILQQLPELIDLQQQFHQQDARWRNLVDAIEAQTTGKTTNSRHHSSAMTQSNSDLTQNTFNISDSSITNLVGSGAIHYNEASQRQGNQEPLASMDLTKEAQKKTILILPANPKSIQKLRLDEEVREIDAGLQRSKQRDRFTLEPRWAVRSRDIQRAMLDLKPTIVHFCGQGEGIPEATTAQNTSIEPRKLIAVHDWDSSNLKGNQAEGLFLEDETGKAKLVSPEALAALFELFTDCVKCVVLNACYCEAQAKAIARQIPFVIGINKVIGDKAAIEFAVGFYDALGAGESVERAYKFGCVNLHMAGLPEHLAPVIVRK